MNKNTIKNSHFDKFNVEATSINDLDGCATTEANGILPPIPESPPAIRGYRPHPRHAEIPLGN